jgi:hypothetical protein
MNIGTLSPFCAQMYLFPYVATLAHLTDQQGAPLSCTCMISYQQYDTDSILQLTSTNTAKLVIRTILTHHNKRNNPSNAPTNTRWCLWRMVYQQYIILYPVYHHDVQAPTGTDKDTELSIGSLQNEEQRNS